MQDQYVPAQSPFRTDVPTRVLGAPEDINVGAPQMGGPANGRALGAPEAPRQFANGNRFFNAQGMARQPYRDTFAPGADGSMPRGMNRMMHQMQRASGNTANPERQFANGNQFVNANGMLRKPYRNMPGQMQGGMGQGGFPAVDDMAGRMQQRQSEVPAGYASPQPPPNWQEMQREFTPPPITDMAAYSAWFQNMRAKYPTYGHGDTTMNLDMGLPNPYSPGNQQFRGPMQSFMGGNPFASMGMQFGMPGGWQGAQPFYPSAQSMPGIGSMFGGY